MDVILAVGPSGMSGPAGYFDLGVSIVTPPYAMTTVTGACDDTTNAVPVQAIMGHDTASVPAALPFSLAYFGETMTEFSVNSNGFVQFYPASGGSPTLPAYFSTPIPSSMPPNGMAAAYWDDLNFVDPTTRALTLISGAAPNRHLTIEWKNFTRSRDPSSRLTFQAKLFETTNVIEFHYCSLTNTSGETASIGLEDAAGTRGIQVGYFRPMTAITSNAYRFTPPP